MNKVKTVILILFIVILTNVTQGIFWVNKQHKLTDKYHAEIATLNTTLEALGASMQVWTVTGKVESGAEIKAEDLQSMTIPSSMVGSTYVTDTSTIVGKLYKVQINPGTALTTDLIMDREIDDTTRDVDIVVDRWTVGLKVGDYIDFRITLPYGDDYIVLSHLRIESVGTNTLKVYMSETQWQQYQGALVDYYLNNENGASIYVTKYVEPGVQKPAETYYAVPKNVKAIMLLDPNIIDKAEATANESMRKSIDKLLNQFKSETSTTEEDAGKLKSGREKLNSSTNGDASVMQTQEGQTDNKSAEEEALSDVFEGEDVIDDGGTVE